MLRAYKAVPLAELRPYAGNARTHSDEQVAQLARSITEFGFTNPVLALPDGTIVAGHGRVLAAASLGWTAVPVLELADLTEPQVRALVIADNQLALTAGWDEDALRAELLTLRSSGYDLGILGFGAPELAGYLKAPDPGRDPDAAPALQGECRSKVGDVWILGPHRLKVGDACQEESWLDLMQGEWADVCWTDPPYNVAYSSKAGKIANDDLSDESFAKFIRTLLGNVYGHLKAGAPCYVAHADTEGMTFRAGYVGAGFKLSGVVVWKKDALVLGRSDYQWIHEPILYGWKPGAAHRWYGGRKNTSVVDLGDGSPFTRLEDGRWQVRIGGQLMLVSGDATVETVVPSLIEEPRPRSSDLHPTMKPVALVERMLSHSARAGDLVVDPCGGSGSTLIAADRLGMSARLIELDPRYADVIIRRWQTYTGRQAVDIVGTPFGE